MKKSDLERKSRGIKMHSKCWNRVKVLTLILLYVIKDYFANAYSTLIVIVDNVRMTLRILVRGDLKELVYFSPILASLRMSF